MPRVVMLMRLSSKFMQIKDRHKEEIENKRSAKIVRGKKISMQEKRRENIKLCLNSQVRSKWQKKMIQIGAHMRIRAFNFVCFML